MRIQAFTLRDRTICPKINKTSGYGILIPSDGPVADSDTEQGLIVCSLIPSTMVLHRLHDEKHRVGYGSSIEEGQRFLLPGKKQTISNHLKYDWSLIAGALQERGLRVDEQRTSPVSTRKDFYEEVNVSTDWNVSRKSLNPREKQVLRAWWGHAELLRKSSAQSWGGEAGEMTLEKGKE